MRRLLILDPGLTSVLSHNYSEAKALLREAQELQWPATVLCHAGAQPGVQGLPARPFFRQLGYGHLEDTRPAADFLAISFCNRSTLQDLQSLPVTRDDFVFFPTVTCNIVTAVCQWISSFERESAPRFGICLMFPPDTNTGGRKSAVAPDTYREAFARIPSELADRVVYTCEIERLSEIYEPLVGARPLTLPIPTFVNTRADAAAADSASHRVALPPVELRAEASRPDEIRLAFLGDAREEKGFHFLPDVVASVCRRRTQTRFLIQAAGHARALVQSVVERLTALHDRVTLIRRPIVDADFLGALQTASLLLLPYDPEKYFERGSTIYSEARRCGIPMVLPAGTAVGDEGDRLGIAATFTRFTVEDIADAAIRAIDQLATLTQAARREAAAAEAAAAGYLSALLSGFGSRD